MGLFAITYPNIDPVLFQIGPVAIRWYALSYVVAILFAWWYGRRIAGNDRLWGPDGSPIAPRLLGDFVVWGTLGVVVGGRLGYVLVYDLQGFLADPISIFAIWEGGMSFHGGFVGTAIALFLFAWRRKIPVWSFIDVIVAGVPVGIFFVRLANFVNGELWGRAADVPWAMVFPADPLQVPRHPSQLYEALTEGVLLFIVLSILIFRFKLLRRPGFITGAFTAGYGAARTFSEFFREPDIQIGFLSGGLTMGMTLSIPLIVAGIIAMIVSTRRHRRTAAPA
ncbi:MAG: prolipoprotein diacylglyceryl transferase [Bauldia sp.]